MNNRIDISVLLPTRGRPQALAQCLTTLIEKSHCPNNIEILLAFDHDDHEHRDYFQTHTAKWLEKIGVEYLALKFQRLGYLRLNEYLNELVNHSRGSWLFFWNDDAAMTTPNWDDVIKSYTGRLRVLRATTNHEHPYAIFPIVPKQWVDITGHLSPHQINDAWISQIGFMLDIVETVPIHIEHSRYDLTGQNFDDTFKSRVMLENLGPNDPRDFNHRRWREIRMAEAQKLAKYLHEVEHRNLDHFRDGLAGRVNIWKKMKELDVKNQMRINATND